METLVQEKVLSQFVNNITPESSVVQPINIDINRTNVDRMIWNKTMTTNDGNYFIKYGGYPRTGNYNAIEVYSGNSLDNNQAVYVFDNLQIENHTFYIRDMKQAEDGRFYAIGYFADVQGSSVETYYYLIIFNNFIQDGYCQINKYYVDSDMGLSNKTFMEVAKVPNTGVYFIHTANNELIRFEINILEGNKTSIATIADGDGTISGSYQPQLNVLKDKLIFTKLWETEDYAYEYTKTVIDANEELPSTITLNRILRLPFTQYVAGAENNPYEAIIPYLSSGNIYFIKIDINGNVNRFGDYSRTFNNSNNLYAYLADNYASVTDNSNLYLYYAIDEGPVDERLIEFYNGTFSGYYSKTQILKQNNIVNLIGTASAGAQQSIVSIKNIYSPNTTSEPYFEYDFCLPYYMNLYSDSNDDTSLIFSRDATARFYSGNQITSTFIVPNYLLNDGNIEKASVYGKTNYLLNDTIEDYEKNRFESLYFNFIYNLNVIDNTNGLNILNQIGSNKVANGLWKIFDNYDLELTKARITYEDLSTEIIELTLVNIVGGTAIFNYNVNGNITQIEYLSNDESTVYATYKRKISGSHTITQVVKTIPNDIGTANGTSIYINDSSSLRFANIIIDGNTTQNGTPTPSNQVPINSAGDVKNLYFLPEEGSSNGINYTKNDDGTINLVGTATANVNFQIFKNTTQSHIEDGATYTFSSNQALPSGVEFRVEAFNGTSWLRHLIGSVLNNYYQVFTGTANLANATRIRHLIYITSGTTVNLTNLEIQFEKGSVKTSFTPEGKGFINEVISNKNRLPAINGSYTSYELTTDWEGNTAIINGTCTQTWSNFMGSSLIPIYLTADEYTISASDYTYNYTFRFQLKDGTIKNTNIVGRSSTIEFTQDVVAYRCWIYRSDLSSVTFSNYKVSFQIEKGSSATSFVPHQEQNISIPCQQPMRSIGNARDEFIKQDGLWYEKHNIGEVVLNGSRDWVKSSTYSNEKYFCGYLAYGISNSIVGSFTINDSFQIGYYVDVLDEECMSSMPQLHVRILASRLTENSVNAFKTWLSTHNTEVIYQLNEPIYLECTQEQLQVLESITQAHTYKHITNINSTDITPAYLEVLYYKQL